MCEFWLSFSDDVPQVHPPTEYNPAPSPTGHRF